MQLGKLRHDVGEDPVRAEVPRVFIALQRLADARLVLLQERTPFEKP